MEVVEFITNPDSAKPFKGRINNKQQEYSLDFCDIKGQYIAKRVLELAASGFHNVLMIGPPGSGKSMISKALPSILPEMTNEEILET